MVSTISLSAILLQPMPPVGREPGQAAPRDRPSLRQQRRWMLAPDPHVLSGLQVLVLPVLRPVLRLGCSKTLQDLAVLLVDALQLPLPVGPAGEVPQDRQAV
eukprot:CAMPEP_0168368762 /NCGR_PEP_ID=MMETSP0228-20121227/6415_1 /TAXON_ID=133427 /ORGANISM="Protoceratium reticulatum, Strain CCCM 535 (=CCMP 1889)" /LENGTH=101 /DNA_ID=CAMNT_0008381613 /DNA_START=108 /DNA_END=413 /DNA_ORIENTATION=-